MLEEELQDVKRKIVFKKRPQEISVEFRTIYIISKLLLIIENCSRGNKISLIQVQIIFYIMSKESYMVEILEDLNNIKKIGVERNYFINRALNLAINDNLISMQNGKYTLIEKGEKFLKLIKEDEELLREEKIFLKKLGKRMTLTLIKEL